MSSFTRILLVLACCTVFTTCRKAQLPSQDPTTCWNSCEGTYGVCRNGCASQPDNSACPERCGIKMQNCKDRCG
jgi:hypothetical protein